MSYATLKPQCQGFDLTKHPFRYFYKASGKWSVRIPNGDGTYFVKYALTKDEADKLVEESGVIV